MSGTIGRLRPKISVIVVNWNGKHFLDTCLTALGRQSFTDFEVILVDNGSADGSEEYVRANFPEVRLLALEENRGFTGGNIAGWKEARGELIILLNNDTEVHPRWLEEIHGASLAYPEAGGFACKMLMFDERTRIDNCGFELAATGTSFDLGRGRTDGPEWSRPREVFGACGGAAVYQRSMLEKVGFFDDDFFMTFEDVDLNFRAQLQGFKCIFVPGAIVYHHLRGTMRKHNARQIFFSQRNNEYFYLKNMPLPLLLRFIPRRILYEAGACTYFCLLGQAGPFFKAKLDVVRNLGPLLRKRKQVQGKRTLAARELRQMMCADTLRSDLRRRWAKFRGALPEGLRRRTRMQEGIS
jgi:GT2 family glycosyltransferase